MKKHLVINSERELRKLQAESPERIYGERANGEIITLAENGKIVKVSREEFNKVFAIDTSKDTTTFEAAPETKSVDVEYFQKDSKEITEDTFEKTKGEVSETAESKPKKHSSKSVISAEENSNAAVSSEVSKTGKRKRFKALENRVKHLEEEVILLRTALEMLLEKLT